MALSISGSFARYDAYPYPGDRLPRRQGPAAEAQSSGAASESQPPRAAAEKDDPSKAKGPGGKPLSDGDRKTVDELEKRDRAVRAHEQAHMAAGGALVRGGASFEFQAGPDGQRYAVGGEVSIDTSQGRTPMETIARAQAIRAAALAPADPSGADRAVAARAARMEADARKELQARGPQDAGPSTPSSDKAPESQHPSAPESGEAAPEARRTKRRPERPKPEAPPERKDDPRVAWGIAAYQSAVGSKGPHYPQQATLELLA